jgi:hypothetical protein
MLQSLVSTHSIWVGEESTYSMQGEPSAGTALWLGYTTSRSVVSILSDKIAKLMYIREGLGREFKIRFRAYCFNHRFKFPFLRCPIVTENQYMRSTTRCDSKSLWRQHGAALDRLFD